MYKKIINYFVLLLIGTFVVFQSCNNEPPVLPTNEVGEAGKPFCNIPNVYCNTGTIKVQNLESVCPGFVPDPPVTIELWVGATSINTGTMVGYVQFVPVGSEWSVKYIFDDELFVPSVIHFAIEDILSDIPQNNGGPIPGQFEYSFNGPFGPDFTFPITLPADPDNDGFYVAAHAGGSYGIGIGGLNYLMPLPPDPISCVTLTDVFPNYPNNTYLTATLGNAGGFEGTYNAWCADNASSHGPSTGDICVQLRSIYEPWPPELSGFPLIDHPENLLKVNYLLNHFQAGTTEVIPQSDIISCGDVGDAEVVTVDDIQAAIWILLDEGPGNILNFDQGRVNAILCAVKNITTYDPCLENEDMLFMAVPNPIGGVFPIQPLLIKVPCQNVPGGSSGVTAWGDGKYGARFVANNWGKFFRWIPVCTP